MRTTLSCAHACNGYSENRVSSISNLSAPRKSLRYTAVMAGRSFDASHRMGNLASRSHRLSDRDRNPSDAWIFHSGAAGAGAGTAAAATALAGRAGAAIGNAGAGGCNGNFGSTRGASNGLSTITTPSAVPVATAEAIGAGVRAAELLTELAAASRVAFVICALVDPAHTHIPNTREVVIPGFIARLR